MTGIHNADDFDLRLQRIAHGEPDPELERHIMTCDDCQEQLTALRHLDQYRTTTGGSLVEPPESLLTSLSGLFAKVRPDLVTSRPSSFRETVAERIRQITAQLILDTGGSPQLAGLRSGGGRTRQVAFVSDVADLDLEVTPQNGAFTVAGQLGMDTVPSDLRIRFIPDDQDPLAADAVGVIENVISEQGYFVVTLTPGAWVAAVEIDDAVVLFPGVRL